MECADELLYNSGEWPKFIILNIALRRTMHVVFWISSSRRIARDIIRMLGEKNLGFDPGHWSIMFMNARKDKFTNVEGFSLVFEL